jgi:hypothetical protein
VERNWNKLLWRSSWILEIRGTISPVPKHHAVKVETSTLDWDAWSAPCFYRFSIPAEKEPLPKTKGCYSDLYQLDTRWSL